MIELDHAMVYIDAMSDAAHKVPVSSAKAQLTDLVRRAEAGEDIVLTRNGRDTVRLVAVTPMPARAELRRALEALRQAGKTAAPGPCAARSQDFLYDEDGLPA